jgi:hypothetical protein
LYELNFFNAPGFLATTFFATFFATFFGVIGLATTFFATFFGVIGLATTFLAASIAFYISDFF